MKHPLQRAIGIGLMGMLLHSFALAEPHGGPEGRGGFEHGGGGFHGGPEYRGGYEYRGGDRGWGEWGPRRGYGLPDVVREVWIGSMLYFFAAGTYYLWNADRQQYLIVPPPAAVPVAPVTTYYEIIAYPVRGQSPDQQARDRYECHRWAVSQSGFDPSISGNAYGSALMDTYRRASAACFVGRGYSVN